MAAKHVPIRFDFSGWLRREVTRDALRAMDADAHRVRDQISSDIDAGRMDFTKLPADKKLLRASIDLADRMRAGIEDVVVCGIGGSALGFLALTNALLHPRHNELPGAKRGGPRWHVLDNADADAAAACLDLVNPKKTLVVVISKSGGGGETSANFQVMLEALVAAHGDSFEKALRRVVVITDPAKGTLRQFADERGVASLPIPPGVGGRFSVLTPVGVFPAALLGMDVAALVAGAGAMLKRCRTADPWADPAITAAILLDLHYRAQRRTTVFMPYANSLWRTADWFRQLWAESLGKAVDREGRAVHVGMTPMAALGATDQHSQVQLFAEGPDDKTYLFVRTRATRDVTIPPARFAPETYGFLDNRGMDELLNTEGDATEAALAHFGRPTARITLARTDAHGLGQLFMFLEMLTASVGALWKIDAFDQPGVELGKILTRFGMGVDAAGDTVIDPASGTRARDLLATSGEGDGSLVF